MEKFRAEDMLGSMKFLVDGVDMENHKIPVILSDETEVVRYSWRDGKYFLTLKHGTDNIDLSRKDILSLFVNHRTHDLPIGKFEDVRIEDNKLKAWAAFDVDDEDSMKIFRKLSKGFLQSFSVGINVINKELVKEEDGVKYYDVTKWSIDEASVVGIPAIPSAKVGLQEENSGENRHQALAKNQNSEQGSSMEYTKLTFEALKAENAEALKNGVATATTAERKRVGEILSLGGSAEFTAKAIDDGSSAGDTAIALLKSRAAELKKEKTNFEDATKDLENLSESEEKETLSDDAKAQLEAEKALENFGGK